MTANELKITDLRVADIDGLPKHMILLKIYTQGSSGTAKSVTHRAQLTLKCLNRE